jgi:hypothetical protein
MAEMHAGGSGVRFWVVEGGESHRGTCSMVAGGRSARGERRGGHLSVVVATGSWLGGKSGAQAVLAAASAGRSRSRRCRATVVHPWTRWQLRILSPAPLLCRSIGAGPCLGKGWRPLRSWMGRSRRDGTAHQQRQQGVGVHAQCGFNSKAMA